MNSNGFNDRIIEIWLACVLLKRDIYRYFLKSAFIICR
ncbi:hypothetical protein SAMN05444288_0530 [Hoylesella oralis]|nr:hypothetical protein SAMN05444288_0530 [Hoylesella oralis]